MTAALDKATLAKDQLFVGVLIRTPQFQSSHQHNPEQQQTPDKAGAGAVSRGPRDGQELQNPARSTQPERRQPTDRGHNQPTPIQGS